MAQAEALAVTQSRQCARNDDLPRVGVQLDQLQFLRFVAASAVMVFHLFNSYKIDFGWERNYFALGANGVDIFFVLSGFVIAYSTRPELGPVYFAIRRIARIVPLYWTLTFVIGAVALVFPHLLNSTTFSWTNLSKSLFFIPYRKENGLIQPMLFLGWTLNYEMFFYLIFSLTLFLQRWSPIYPCILVVALVLLGQLLPFNNLLFRFYTDSIMLEFVFGIALCQLWLVKGTHFRRYQTQLLAAAAVMFVLSLSFDTGPLRPFVQGTGAVGLLAATLSIGIPRNRIGEALVLCGSASYSLYLLHPYILQIFTKYFGRNLGVTSILGGSIIAIGISILCSIALYLTLEVKSRQMIVGK